MQYHEVMNVLAQSNKNDWNYNDNNGVYIYKPNVCLRIEKKRDKVPYLFYAEWANNHPNPSANKESFAIYYNSSLIYNFTLVSVDGGRAALPMPEPGTAVVSKINYQYASIVDDVNRLDEYITRSQLTVDQ